MRKCDRPNVLFVMIDALRADRLHCYGNPWETSPAIDRLASEGVLFRNLISHATHTLPAMASMFTGLDPLTHGLTDPRTHASHDWKGWQSPIDILEKDGYAIAGQDDNAYFHLGHHLQPKDVDETNAFFVWRVPYHSHLPYDPAPPYDTAFLPPDHPISDATRRRLEIVKSKMILHRPGLISQFEVDEARGVTDSHAGGIEKEVADDRSAAVLALEPEDRVPVTALYDGTVRTSDDEVGQYIHRLEELGLLDDTVVVITSDHGEELLERGTIGHSSCSLAGTLYDEVLRPPLVLRYPACLPRGKVIETQVSQIDIMPTVFELLGFPMPQETEGRSLLPLIRGEEIPFVEETYAMTRPCGWQLLDDDERETWCVRTPSWKFIHYTGDANGRDELYNLKEDPHEKDNVISRHPDTARELKQKLQAWIGKKPSPFMP